MPGVLSFVIAAVTPRRSGRRSASFSNPRPRALSSSTSAPVKNSIWTKPASSDTPSMNESTVGQSYRVGSASKTFDVSSHHALCSGRALFARAASSDSKRTTATKVPSSATPLVSPRYPFAPGLSSACHCSDAARIAAASVTCPLTTWMYMLRPFAVLITSSRY
jgi:hypothetical protein